MAMTAAHCNDAPGLASEWKSSVVAEAVRLCHNLPRYIRLRKMDDDIQDELNQEFENQAEPVPWLEMFFSLPAQINISSTNLYRKGKLFGMDASSGATVKALELSKGDHCLDLCCAPGMKLCFMADLVGPCGSVTGVDIDRKRLATCRTAAKRAQLNNVRLYLGNGATFAIGPPSADAMTAAHGDRTDVMHIERTIVKQKQSKRQRSRARKALQEKRLSCAAMAPVLFHTADARLNGEGKPGRGYDRVLVDAECTHDGSVSHVAKLVRGGRDEMATALYDSERIKNAASLQKILLRQGFSMLRPGGKLVYSTCSLMSEQNEDIVADFLRDEPNAALGRVGCADWPVKSVMGQCVLFDPTHSNTKGQFICCLEKKL